MSYLKKGVILSLSKYERKGLPTCLRQAQHDLPFDPANLDMYYDLFY